MAPLYVAPIWRKPTTSEMMNSSYYQKKKKVINEMEKTYKTKRIIGDDAKILLAVFNFFAIEEFHNTIQISSDRLAKSFWLRN